MHICWHKETGLVSDAVPPWRGLVEILKTKVDNNRELHGREMKKREMFQIMQESLKEKAERRSQAELRELEERKKYKQYLDSLDRRKEEIVQIQKEKNDAKHQIYL